LSARAVRGSNATDSRSAAGADAAVVHRHPTGMVVSVEDAKRTYMV
jgi:hypothetical protein